MQITQPARWKDGLITRLLTAHIETGSAARWLKPLEVMPPHCCLTDTKADDRHGQRDHVTLVDHLKMAKYTYCEKINMKD